MKKSAQEKKPKVVSPDFENKKALKKQRRQSALNRASGGLASDIKKSQDVDDSNAIDDPWAGSEGQYKTLVPPYSPIELALLEENSNQLSQCATAYDVNIPGFGWRLKPKKDVEVAMKDNPEFAEKVLAEKEFFESKLTYIDYDEQSFTKLRRLTRHEQEITGNGYWEVIRDSNGRICAFRKVASTSMRLQRIQPVSIPVERVRPVGKGEERTTRTDKIFRRFRRFVQSRIYDGRSRPVYFKEYGDPRRMSSETGEYQREDHPVEDEDLATEIIHFRVDSCRSPYGIPRFIGNLLSITGSRKSEEINYTTFSNNNIPSMAILVSNGEVSSDSVTRIESFVETAIQESNNFSKILVIEAEPSDSDFEGAGANTRIELKPLTREQHTDELFQNYDKSNREKVRESFRLPPLFVGRAEDYTRATAETSRRLADEQVFNPERVEDDYQMNQILLQEGMIYHDFITNTPNVTNDQDLIAVITGAEKAGGMTPRIAREILEDILNRELPPFPDGFDPDLPFSLSMAEAVKNLGQPNEPGQQVTALKSAEKDSTWLDRIQNAVVAQLSENHISAPVAVAINAGSQATDLAKGRQRAFISSVSLGVGGRDMFLSDGQSVIAKIRFGEVSRLSIREAALASGLEEEDIRMMNPGREEVYVVPVAAREEVAPIQYDQPEDSMFTVLQDGT